MVNITPNLGPQQLPEEPHNTTFPLHPSPPVERTGWLAWLKRRGPSESTTPPSLAQRNFIPIQNASLAASKWGWRKIVTAVKPYFGMTSSNNQPTDSATIIPSKSTITPELQTAMDTVAILGKIEQLGSQENITFSTQKNLNNKIKEQSIERLKIQNKLQIDLLKKEMVPFGSLFALEFVLQLNSNKPILQFYNEMKFRGNGDFFKGYVLQAKAQGFFKGIVAQILSKTLLWVLPKVLFPSGKKTGGLNQLTDNLITILQNPENLKEGVRIILPILNEYFAVYTDISTQYQLSKNTLTPEAFNALLKTQLLNASHLNLANISNKFNNWLFNQMKFVSHIPLIGKIVDWAVNKTIKMVIDTTDPVKLSLERGIGIMNPPNHNLTFTILSTIDEQATQFTELLHSSLPKSFDPPEQPLDAEESSKKTLSDIIKKLVNQSDFDFLTLRAQIGEQRLDSWLASTYEGIASQALSLIDTFCHDTESLLNLTLISLKTSNNNFNPIDPKNPPLNKTALDCEVARKKALASLQQLAFNVVDEYVQNPWTQAKKKKKGLTRWAIANYNQVSSSLNHTLEQYNQQIQHLTRSAITEQSLNEHKKYLKMILPALNAQVEQMETIQQFIKENSTIDNSEKQNFFSYTSLQMKQIYEAIKQIELIENRIYMKQLFDDNNKVGLNLNAPDTVSPVFMDQITTFLRPEFKEFVDPLSLTEISSLNVRLIDYKTRCHKYEQLNKPLNKINEALDLHLKLIQLKNLPNQFNNILSPTPFKNQIEPCLARMELLEKITAHFNKNQVPEDIAQTILQIRSEINRTQTLDPKWLKTLQAQIETFYRKTQQQNPLPNLQTSLENDINYIQTLFINFNGTSEERRLLQDTIKTLTDYKDILKKFPTQENMIQYQSRLHLLQERLHSMTSIKQEQIKSIHERKLKIASRAIREFEDKRLLISQDLYDSLQKLTIFIKQANTEAQKFSDAIMSRASVKTPRGDQFPFPYQVLLGSSKELLKNSIMKAVNPVFDQLLNLSTDPLQREVLTLKLADHFFK